MNAVDVAIVGAGVSGLSAAFRLSQTGQTIQVLEAGSQPGGLIRTLHDSGFVMEGGPNTFPSTASAILELCAALKLTPEPASPLARKRYLYLNKKLTALPTGLWEAVTTPVLSTGCKLAFLNEPGKPKTEATEISIAEFFRHRLGPEAVAKLIDPFISGVYAGDITQLSLPAIFPRLWQWEQEHGSLFRGAMASRKGKKSKTRMRMLNFKGGMQTLTDTLVKALPATSLRLNTKVLQVQKTENGFTLNLENGEILSAYQVVLATPAYVTAELLSTLLPNAAKALAEIPYNRIAVVHAGFKKSAISHPLDGFGFLVPRREGLPLLGSIWASSLFPDRAPDGHILLSNFIGGAHQPEIPTWDDPMIEQQVTVDLARAFQCRDPLKPAYSKVLRYERAIPQYTLGHRERMHTIETDLQTQPCLALCGNYLHGLGLNECVQSGLSAAERLDTQPVFN